jgi:hypothetical protein
MLEFERPLKDEAQKRPVSAGQYKIFVVESSFDMTRKD